MKFQKEHYANEPIEDFCDGIETKSEAPETIGGTVALGTERLSFIIIGFRSGEDEVYAFDTKTQIHKSTLKN